MKILQRFNFSPSPSPSHSSSLSQSLRSALQMPAQAKPTRMITCLSCAVLLSMQASFLTKAAHADAGQAGPITAQPITALHTTTTALPTGSTALLNTRYPSESLKSTDTGEQVENSFVTLTFHDVRDDVAKIGDRDIYAISTQNLAQYFAWLKASDWQAISMRDLQLARENKKKLPAKAVLLTFDDGALSSYTRVFPLLKTYEIPAVFAIPTSWINGNTQDGYEAYGEGNLMNWAQMREMQQSGWVEFGSHSDDMHTGLVANPQLNTQPRAAARGYDPITQQFETDAAYRQRVYQDLKRSKNILDRELGINATAIFWPYGAVTQESSDLAHQAGFTWSFSLGKKMSAAQDPVIHQRALIMENPTPEQIHELMVEFMSFEIAPYKQSKRILNVDLAALLSPSLAQSDEKLGLMLNRVHALQSNTLIFKAVSADPTSATGYVAYFPNRHLPMQQDLLNRAVWQSRTRIFNRTYAELPLSLAMTQQQVFAETVEDLVKNNASIEGLMLDGGDALACAIRQPTLSSDCEKSLDSLLLAIQSMKQKSRYYTNFSNNHQTAVKFDVGQTQLQGLDSLLTRMRQHTDFTYLTLDPVQQPRVFAALLQYLTQLDEERKKHLMISFKIKADATAAEMQQYQKDFQMLKTRAVQKLAVDNYGFENAQAIHQYLYSALSLNDSPLTYRDPFQDTQSAKQDVKGGQR